MFSRKHSSFVIMNPVISLIDSIKCHHTEQRLLYPSSDSYIYNEVNIQKYGKCHETANLGSVPVCFLYALICRGNLWVTDKRDTHTFSHIGCRYS